jgi:type I restriction enzyme R subunit
VQQTNFWQDVDFQTLEMSRQQLRTVIHLRAKDVLSPKQVTPIIDIHEDQGEYRITEVKTDIITVEYQIYKQQVEATLTPLFDKSDVLQKIRKGQAVTEQDLATLNALVHTQNPDVDLTTLKTFYPESTAGLDQILRTIVGLDEKQIEAKFTDFVQKVHMNMNVKQQRFIGLLKNHLCRYGFVEIDQLYEAPFTSIHDDGLDGVFNEKQADFVQLFIKQFDIGLGDKTATVEHSV